MPEGLTDSHEQLFVTPVEVRFRRILRKAYRLKTLSKLPLTSTDAKSDPAMPKEGDALVICRADGTTDFLVLGSGIVNDANDYANETVGDPRYPFDLLRRVITVSLETMKIVRELPPLDI